MVQRVGRQDGDDVEGDSVGLQPVNALEHAVQRWLALARLAVAILQEGGAVDTDAQVDAMPTDERTPSVVEQGGVGLKRMMHGDAEGIVLLQQCDGVFVKVERHDRRFPGVPKQREFGLDQTAGEDPREGLGERFARHAAFVESVGKVAIGAIEIAEGGRLHDEQFERSPRVCLGSHGDRPRRGQKLRQPPL